MSVTEIFTEIVFPVAGFLADKAAKLLAVLSAGLLAIGFMVVYSEAAQAGLQHNTDLIQDLKAIKEGGRIFVGAAGIYLLGYLAGRYAPRAHKSISEAE